MRLAGWAFLLLIMGFVIAVTSWLYRHNPALLTERMAGTNQSGPKFWDKIVLTLTGVLFVAWLALMPLDAVRFGWSQVPVWLQAIGAFVLLFSFYVFFVTFRENSYLSPVVRRQEERGQTVVTTGPYHVVRHPMYAAFTALVVGTTLLLGSWYGLLVTVLLVGIMARRAVLEETTLKQELPGYDAYMGQVKYRFVPYLW